MIKWLLELLNIKYCDCDCHGLGYPSCGECMGEHGL